MNKAVPWNINGVGFDAREAAREAARRQGKSLGEWLDGVIAGHAAEYGLEMDDVDVHDRIEAVKAKLERLSARPRHGSGETETEPGRRPSKPHRAGNRFDSRGRDRFDPEDRASARDEKDATSRNRRLDPGEYDRDDRQPRRPKVAPDDTELLLEEAIAAMERRATLVERKGEKALASIAQMIEAAEHRREDEHEMFVTLSRKLSDMEERIADRVSEDHYRPIKGALTRLEARLDAFGRRSQREAPAKSEAGDAVLGPRGRSQGD
ncbi:MAG: hypothetical protein P4L76_03545, partial [Beijerinckiaceae bacterium]|nr:hypothetical protein [Beijerinckiaceae bacterium]